MNTPPQSKRWNAAYSPGLTPPSGNYVGTLRNPDYASRLARITSEFVHLESLMAFVLAVLLGVHTEDPAGYVMRSIKSPRGRVDVMWDLLEKAPYNKDLGPEYDRIIREFWVINLRRNDYVHGLWWTSGDDGSVYITTRNDDGLGFANVRPATLSELDEVIDRIGGLVREIINGPVKDLGQRRSRQSRLEQSAPPKSE